MKRGGPLKRSDKPMAHGGLPSTTKAQSAVMDKLRSEIGCAVCLFIFRIEGSDCEIHHLTSGGYRISHDLVIPLCPSHHRGVNAEQCALAEPGFTYRHSDRGSDGGTAAFEKAYGTEYELLEKCEQWINNNYSHNYNADGLLPDEQAPQGDDRSAYTDANDQPDDEHARTEVEQLQAFDTPVHISITHYRSRLCDPDNLNAKGVIDALVEGGLLFDDSAKEVRSITHDQIKVKSRDEEKTRITIEEVGA